MEPLEIWAIPEQCLHSFFIIISLENKLKNFSVVAKKDRIHIEHLGKEYIIDIVDCQPRIVGDIIETDVEVDIEYAEKYLLFPPFSLVQKQPL